MTSLTKFLTLIAILVSGIAYGQFVTIPPGANKGSILAKHGYRVTINPLKRADFKIGFDANYNHEVYLIEEATGDILYSRTKNDGGGSFSLPQNISYEDYNIIVTVVLFWTNSREGKVYYNLAPIPLSNTPTYLKLGYEDSGDHDNNDVEFSAFINN